MRGDAFTWGWGDHPRQPDPSMTRGRMAGLMRTWRRAMRNPAHGGGHINEVRCMDRLPGMRVYEVVNTPTGERATFGVGEVPR